MIKIFQKYRLYLILIAIILACVLLTYANLQFTKSSQGNSEFFTNWTVIRNFLKEGQNPYIVQADEGSGLNYSLPLYSIVLFIPFALVKDFVLANALWMTLLEFCILAILLLSIQLMNWQIKPVLLAALILLGIFGYHGIMPLIDGNLIIFSTLLVTGILLAIRKKQDEVAGLLLAFITISPTPIILFFVFVVIWVITNRRTKVLTWFFGTLGLLIGFSIALIPNWIFQFLQNFIEYYKSIQPGSPGVILISRWGDIGNRFSIIISVLVGILLLLEWVQASRGGMKRFIWTAMITLALSTWSGIKINPISYLMLYPALIMGLELICERWNQRAYGIVLSVMALLFLADWGIYFLTMSKDLHTGISSFLFIPLPITVLFLLYWSKWWVLKSNRVELEPPLIELQKL